MRVWRGLIFVKDRGVECLRGHERSTMASRVYLEGNNEKLLKLKANKI